MFVMELYIVVEVRRDVEEKEVFFGIIGSETRCTFTSAREKRPTCTLRQFRCQCCPLRRSCIYIYYIIYSRKCVFYTEIGNGE